MKNIAIFIFLFAGFLASCTQDSGRDFQTTESGLRYKLLEQTDDNRAELGDILKLEMIYLLNNDSVIFSSVEQNQPVYIELIEPEYPGDIYEAFALLSRGDSASFIINAEDFFLQTAQMPFLPPFASESDDIYFQVRLLETMDVDEYMEEQMRLAEQQMRDAQQRSEMEDEIMEEYLLEHGITAQPLESGLIFIEEERGTGPQVEQGQTVAVHYEGRLLDGTVFDSSLERGEPIEFRVGMGQVIPGWDEGISNMRVGGKAQLIIPSYLAYGEQGAGNVIPPFSTLVFDVEVTAIRD